MLYCFVFLRCFVFCLSFFFSLILHPSCIIILIHIFFSFPHFSWFICLFVTKRESILESVLECIVISYDSCAPSQEEKFYLVHIYRGRNFIGEMHIPRGRRHLLWENLVLFSLHYVCFLVCFMVLWVMFSIYALLLSSHCVCVLDMHTSLCYCVFLIACSDDHLLCYMIIVVISIWLSCVWSSCSYVSHYVYLIVYLLVTLYLSFITCYTLRV